MIITEKQERDFHNCERCWICDGEFKKDDVKVRDHCNFTGQYRGCAHSQCNLNAALNKHTTIPIFFHNLNYDWRQVITAFESIGNMKEYGRNINVIANNQEQYKTMKLDCFQFKDSMAFLGASLEKLIDNVPDDQKVAMRNITDEPELFKRICKEM